MFSNLDIEIIISDIKLDIDEYNDINDDYLFEIHDILHKVVFDNVENRTYMNNKEIIEEYYNTDIYDAIKSYKETYDDIDITSYKKNEFYSILAYYYIYIDIMENYFDDIEIYINNLKDK